MSEAVACRKGCGVVISTAAPEEERDRMLERHERWCRYVPPVDEDADQTEIGVTKRRSR